MSKWTVDSLDPEQKRKWSWQVLKQTVMNCKKCPLLVESRETEEHGRPVMGKGSLNSPAILVGEAPGRLGAGRTGIPFKGDMSGDLLFWCLKHEKLDPFKDLYITNCVKCLPKDLEKGTNRTPSTDECLNCYPYLIEEINLVKPKIIIALGRVPERSLKKYLPRAFRKKLNIVYHPHPAYLIRQGIRAGAPKAKSYAKELARLISFGSTLKKTEATQNTL